MRTDCKVTRHRQRIPYGQLGAGNQRSVGPGDMIRWSDADWINTGRVIGKVTAPDVTEPTVCVAALLLSGQCCERWVPVSRIVECVDCQSDKGQWLFGSAFTETPIDRARQCFELLAAELGRANINQVGE